MTVAEDLWASVVEHYDAAGLRLLTNVRNRAATSINADAGVRAAGAVLALWDALSQGAFDPDSDLHTEIARQGVIAILQGRGASAPSIARVSYKAIFDAEEGLIANVKRTESRARIVPETNSDVMQAPATSPVLGWSDPRALPDGIFPTPRRFLPGVEEY